MDCKEIQPIHPKGDQSWMFIGRTDVEAETPTFWPPDVKNWLTWKDPDAGKDWRQEEKGTKEDEMVGWHHWLNGHESEYTPGAGDGHGGLEWCSPWGRKRVRYDWVTDLNWTDDRLCQSSNWAIGQEWYFTHLEEAQRVVQKNKISNYFQCFPNYLPWSDGTRCHDLSFLSVEF